MNTSLIFRASLVWIKPLLLLVSLWILWRGHNLPGGGFIGGLVAASAFLLEAWARPSRGPELAQQPTQLGLFGLRLSSPGLIAFGLLLGLFSVALGPILDQAPMQGLWTAIPLLEKIGTPVIFDIGVFFVVLGAGTGMVLPLFDNPGERAR